MPVVNGAGLVGQVRPGHRAPEPSSSCSPTRTSPSGVRLLPDGVPGTARGAGEGEPLVVDTGLDGEHGPRARRLAHHERGRPQRLPGLDPGRHGAGHQGVRRRAHARPPSSSRSSTRQRLTFVHRAAVGGRADDPGRPARRGHPDVASSSSSRSRSRSGSGPDLQVLGVQGDLMLLLAIAAGLAAGPDRGAAVGLRQRPGLRPAAPDPLRPLRADLRAAGVPGRLPAGQRAPRGLVDPAWRPRPRRALVGVILYVVLGTVVGVEFLGVSVPKVAIVVAVLNTLVAAPTIRFVRWATGTQDSVRAPRGVPVNGDSPRLRLSVLGIVAFSLFAALFAAPLVPPGDGGRRVPGRGRGQPHPRCRRRGAAGPHPRPQRQGASSTTASPCRSRSTVRRSATSTRTSALAVLTQVADALSRSGTPKTVEQLEERIADQRFSPYVPGPHRQRRSGGPQDLDRRARGRAAVGRRASGWPCATTRTGTSPRTSSGYTGKITKEELDAVAGRR